MRKNIIIFILVCLFGIVIAGCDSVNNLSGTVSFNKDTSKTSGASVYVNDTETYYESIAEAWKKANTETSAKVVFKLWQNWTGTNGNFGLTNEKGFNSLGGLIIETRGAASNKDDTTNSLVVNLNGYTIDAARTEAVENGYVMFIDLTEEDSFHGAITLENGTIKGGNNVNDCGGIFIDGRYTTIKFTNLEITENKSEGNAGGVYEKTNNCYLYFNDLTITGNTCKINGAGYFSHSTATNADDSTKISLKNKVLICNNTQSLWQYSTGFYYHSEKAYQTDHDNVLPNARFIELNHSSDSKILFSFNASSIIITYEIEYGTAERAQNGTFKMEYNDFDPGFRCYRTEDGGCGDDIEYGYLHW